MELVNDAVVVH